MLSPTNIEEVLLKKRNKRISSAALHQELLQEIPQHLSDQVALSKASVEEAEVGINPVKLKSDRIFHLQDIRSLCITYRLRFLDASFFKGSFPVEAISAIQKIEKEHGTSLQHFKIMAPSKLLKLENADDPLLFIPLGCDYFYLIHKWGNDLHPLRRWLMWPYICFENLVFTVFILSMLLTAMTPLGNFTPEVTAQEYLLFFLFMFKAVAGIVLFYGFAKGKNFNNAIWNSKYYNA